MHRKLGIALAVLVALGFFLIFPKKTPLFKPHQVTGDSTLQAPFNEAASPELLSRDVNFPTPVIQLQQTVAHGLIEAERTDLPLLKGELAEFSQTNIREEYPSPPELKDLKQRLNQLQSINQHQ
ncbi:hypothetical protein [Vibrio pacinii]|uniref:hypothetical protein n=1 Tax=Vibrio pacinii TaxID=170674 RepID=UPI00056EFD9B|nr:hypothetical protein [Vibrio pacinii]